MLRVHPTESKVAAIFNAAELKNVSELLSFLVMLQYYSRFIPKLSCYLKPLHDLLQTDVPWNWTPKCKGAFNKAKQTLVSVEVLTHYDVNKPLRLGCDASL